jgi:hypothetical protein
VQFRDTVQFLGTLAFLIFVAIAEQFIMVCNQNPPGGAGRWAIPEDKPALQTYATAYLAERGSGSLNHPWDDWMQKQTIAVLKYEHQNASVVRYTTTRRDTLGKLKS